MIKLKDLLEKSMLAGRHDEKETLEIVRDMSKKYGISPVPAIEFKKSLRPAKGHKKSGMYAYYDFDRDKVYINQAMNKNLNEFFKSILHELYHVKDSRRLGKSKFVQQYEMEMSYLIGIGKDEYNDNKFEIAAEKFAQNNYKKWVKEYKNKLQMRKNPDNDGF